MDKDKVQIKEIKSRKVIDNRGTSFMVLLNSRHSKDRTDELFTFRENNIGF